MYYVHSDPQASLHFDPMGGQLGVHPAAREEVPT